MQDLFAGTRIDVIAAYVVALAIFVALAAFAVWYGRNPTSSPSWLLFLCGVVGAALGWTVGVLISPYDVGERTAFADIGKLVYGFLSGYLLSKLDPLVTQMVTSQQGAEASRFPLLCAAIALAAFVTSATVTYVSRSYWHQAAITTVTTTTTAPATTTTTTTPAPAAPN